FRNTAEALKNIYLTKADALQANAQQSSSGVSANFSNPAEQIPLAAFSQMNKRVGPLAITRQDQFPAVAVSFNLPTGASLGQALERLSRTQKEIGLPSSIETNQVGSAAAFSSSLKSQPILIVAAIIAVYIVLGILYESYIHPITILSTLPSGGIG